MTDLRLPPPVWLAAAGLLQHRLGGRRRSGSLSRTVAGALAAGSAAALAGSVAGFRRRGTTVDPLHPDRAQTLVTDGPNAVTRNPMYVGMAGLLLAHAAWRRSWPALLPAAGFAVLMDRTQVAAEERALEARFGEEYAAYARRVPRWLVR